MMALYHYIKKYRLIFSVEEFNSFLINIIEFKFIVTNL